MIFLSKSLYTIYTYKKKHTVANVQINIPIVTIMTERYFEKEYERLSTIEPMTKFATREP